MMNERDAKPASSTLQVEQVVQADHLFFTLRIKAIKAITIHTEKAVTGTKI